MHPYQVEVMLHFDDRSEMLREVELRHSNEQLNEFNIKIII